MNFLDKNGHIFNLPSYQSNPVGYEYNELDYTFWVDSEYTKNLSTNNYYIKCVKILYKSDYPVENISITINSKIFSFVSSYNIHKQLKNGLNIEFDESELVKQRLNEYDLILLDVKDKADSEKYVYVIPIYIICNSEEDGSFKTNALININNEYCPIQIGGTFMNVSLKTEINAGNFGMTLPEDIVKAVYQHSFINEKLDKTLYNEKLKEYLLNMMNIKGNCGNIESAVNALKWFGWGDKITLYTLSKTDNEFQDQFIRDVLTINDDNIFAYEYFRKTPLISLEVKENEVTEKRTDFNFNNEIWGENKPVLRNLFDYVIPECDEINGIVYYKSYYDFSIEEIYLKLTVLNNFYKKYFLPLHININSSSVNRIEFMDDVKFSIRPFESYTSKTVIINKNDIDVVFDNNVYILRSLVPENNFLFDDNLNEFSNYTNENINIYDNLDLHYIVSEIYTKIPIRFKTSTKYIDCVFILKDDLDNILYTSHFNFCNNIDTTYNNFIFLPSIFINNIVNNTKYNWEEREYTLHICANNKWFYHKFAIRLPELNFIIGKLEYDYSVMFKQYYSLYEIIKNTDDLNITKDNNIYGLSNEVYVKYKSIFNILEKWWIANPLIYMFDKDLVTVNNINISKEISNLLLQNSDSIESQKIITENSLQKILLYDKKVNEYYLSTEKNLYLTYKDVFDNYIKKNYTETVEFLNFNPDDKIQDLDYLKYFNRVLYYDFNINELENFITLVSNDFNFIFSLKDDNNENYFTIKHFIGLMNFIITEYIHMYYKELYDNYDVYVMVNNDIILNNKNIQFTKESFIKDGISNMWCVLISKQTLKEQTYKHNNDYYINKSFYNAYNVNEIYVDINNNFIANDIYSEFDEQKFEYQYLNNSIYEIQEAFENNSVFVKNIINSIRTFLFDKDVKFTLNLKSLDNRFLINRMKVIENKNEQNQLTNIFKKTDIITCSINNISMPIFIEDFNGKWNIYPFSGYINDSDKNLYVRYSKTNTMLLMFKHNLTYLNSGYYVINCNYTLDGVTQKSVQYPSKIFIDTK